MSSWRRAVTVRRSALPLLAALALVGSSFAAFQQVAANWNFGAILNPLGAAPLLGDSEVRTPLRDAFPREIIDPLGRSQWLSQPPQRVASGVLASDEILSELLPPARVAAVSYLVDDASISNVPAHFPAAITRHHGDIEHYLAVAPDLVIVASYSEASAVNLLLASGVPVLRFSVATSFADIRHQTQLLAQALGGEAEAKADAWLASMDARIARVQAQVAAAPCKRVLFYGMNGHSEGPGSLMDESIRLAGGCNVMAEAGLNGQVQLSQEMAIGLQPDVILVSGWQSADGRSPRDQIMQNPAWRDVPAVRAGQVHTVAGAWLTCGSPYRVIGVEKIAALLHPVKQDEGAVALNRSEHSL